MNEDFPDWPLDPLRNRRERTPDRLALIDADTDGEWTYAELDTFVNDVAEALVEAGVESGDTVATLLDSRPLTVALPFATIRLGATLAPLNVDLDAGTIADQVDRLEPALLLTDSESEAAVPETFDGERWTVEGISGFVQGEGDLSTDGSQNDHRRSPTDSVNGQSPAATTLVVFTSGTTGRPKGVRLTLENLLASATGSACRLGVTPRDRWLSPLSTYHVGGIAPYLRATLYGTTAVLQREFDAEVTARTMKRHDVTGVSFVPTMLRRVLDAGWRPDPDFRFVLLGGGPAPQSLLERCLHLDVPVCPTYGATETASQVATATPGETVTHTGTVGRPIAGSSVEIVDAGEPCAPGEQGELIVEGPTVSPGYLNPAATDETFRDGRFYTGDLGFRDEEGRLWIVGRADDVIVTGGENVQPSQVVDALESQPAVAIAAVVGVPDEEWGERVVALVVSDAEIERAELREWCRDRLPDFAIPKTIQFAEALPRTPSGTVDRAAVRDRFQ